MVMIAGVLLVLPDGRVVLHRRGNDAPTDTGLLSIFGGHGEPDEAPEQTALRELREETSIKDELTLHLLGDYFVGTEKQFFIYRAEIPDTDFEVYEGRGYEVYEPAAARGRSDLAGPADFALKAIG